jgi:hypothetical protein
MDEDIPLLNQTPEQRRRSRAALRRLAVENGRMTAEEAAALARQDEEELGGLRVFTHAAGADTAATPQSPAATAGDAGHLPDA